MPAPPRRLFSFVLPLLGLTGLLPASLDAQGIAPGSSLVIQDSAPPATAAPTPATSGTKPAAPAPAAPPEPPSKAPVIAPMKLDIARRDLKNFLTDAEALTPYRRTDGVSESLAEVFVIGSNAVPLAVFWDPLACRLLGVLDLEAPAPTSAAAPVEPAPAPAEGRDADADEEKKETAPPVISPYLFMAAGPAPLSGTGGASGAPRYFGFRLVGGMPEFLYTLGSLSVEERLWLEDGGKVLKQRFAVREASRGIQLTFPEAWRLRTSVTVGTWKKNVLSVPKEDSGEVIVTYRLTEVAPQPASPQ
jgi:hypothetical protein